MNTNRSTGPTFESRLSEGLDRLASSAPTREPGNFDPTRQATPVSEPERPRTGAYLAAAAVIVAVTVAGLAAVSGRTDNEPALSEQPGSPSSDQLAPVTTTEPLQAESTASTIVEPVRGAPTCGTELPVTIEIPSATGGPLPGPITLGPTAEGQFAQHWEVPAGSIEMRWPADKPDVYDLDQVRGDQSVFDQMAVVAADDGTQIMVEVPNIDPSVSSNGGSTLTMTVTPGVTGLQAPCDILQVRYLDGDGNQVTRGYNVTDFSGGAGENEPGDFFGSDLNSLVTSSGDAADAPDPATTVRCAGVVIDRDTAGPPAATPAEALAAFLASDDTMPGFQTSGYREFEINDNRYQYAIIRSDGALITLFTVNLAGQNWAVSHVTSAGC